MYEALYKPNQLLYGTHESTAIIAGWTPKEYLAKKLNPEEYAVIGQLYSARGINYLVRNLLWNPQIYNLFILNCTREDSNARTNACLLDFLSQGVEYCEHKNKWKIKSQVEGYIDAEVPLVVLDELRTRFIIYVDDDLKRVCDQIKKVSELVPYQCSTQKVQYPLVETESKAQPSNIFGQRVTGQTIAECWVKIIHRIRVNGVIRPTGYDGKWQELIDLVAVVENEPEDFYFPTPNYLPCDCTFIESYIPSMCEDAPYKEGVKYTYGQRLRSWFEFDQIEQCVEKLVKEIDAASAVMSLWDVKDHVKGGSPCLNHIWLRVIDGRLTMTATFRSNDMFNAWVSNAMGLRALQMHICKRINDESAFNLKLGELITVSQSAHIYDDTWGSADEIIEKYYLKQRRTYSDKVGNFIITLKNEVVTIEHLTPGGELIKTYTGNSPMNLMTNIALNNPSIEPSHIGYLGIELAKACYFAVNTPEKYIQDERF